MSQVAGRNSHNGFFFSDQFFLDHVAGNLDGGRAGSFASTCLQHKQLAVFNREFDVLHVTVVVLQDRLDFEQLFVNSFVPLRHFADWLRRANTGNDVFALCVNQKLTVELVLAGRRVPSKCHARARIVAHVSISHRLHIHGGTK